VAPTPGAPLSNRVDSTAIWIESRTSPEVAPSASYREVRAGERIENRPAKGIHGIIDWEYVEARQVDTPAPFVAGMEGGHVVGEHGAVVTPDGSLLMDVSMPIGSLRSYILSEHGLIPDPVRLADEWKLPPKRIRGTTAVLTSYVGRGYFHWLYDILPRVGLLKDAGIDLEDIDTFIVPSYLARFQVETLNALGIPRRKILSSFLERHVVAENLLVPSLTRPRGVVPTWVCEFLKDTFPPVEPQGFDLSEKVYIMRKQTDHGLVPDEENLTAKLEELGFQQLAAENFTLGEKAWILERVKGIVSPSGAGLCNIVFCQPGTKVIELRVQRIPVMEPWDIANRMQLDFYDVLPDDYARDENQAFSTSEGAIKTESLMKTLEMADIP
jgi:capsular polysaccharide biosynthesis protein